MSQKRTRIYLRYRVFDTNALPQVETSYSTVAQTEAVELIETTDSVECVEGGVWVRSEGEHSGFYKHEVMYPWWRVLRVESDVV